MMDNSETIKKAYRVTVHRSYVQEHIFTVEAEDDKQADALAHEAAANEDWKNYHGGATEYTTEEIARVGMLGRTIYIPGKGDVCLEEALDILADDVFVSEGSHAARTTLDLRDALVALLEESAKDMADEVNGPQ